MRKSFNALDIIKKIISENVHEGDICIDATAGRGNDTVFLASLAGDTGHVTAFDIQNEAVESTKELLAKNNLTKRADVLLESHSNMDKYFEKETVSCITFNLGYLPKGDHKIATRKETSIEAIEKGLTLLKRGGIMTIIIYYGGDSGFEEQEAVLKYLPTIDSKKYSVLEMPFVNRPNCPPIPVVIYRDE